MPSTDTSLPSELQNGFSQTLKDEYITAGDPTSRRAVRDKIIFRQLAAYDLEYERFERRLTGNENVFAIATDTTVLGLGAAGSVVGGQTAKSALAAATAFITGMRTAVDKDLFYQSTLPALKAQMQARRLEARAPIVEGLGRSDADYPLQKALVDLGNLRAAASLSAAVVSTTVDAGERAAAAQIRIDRASATAEYKAAMPARFSTDAAIRALSGAQALKMMQDMEPILQQRPDSVRSSLLRVDPNNRRLSSGAAARQFLLMWRANDLTDPASIKQWDDELARINANA
jgi:hypothetical protein